MQEFQTAARLLAAIGPDWRECIGCRMQAQCWRDKMNITVDLSFGEDEERDDEPVVARVRVEHAGKAHESLVTPDGVLPLTPREGERGERAGDAA